MKFKIKLYTIIFDPQILELACTFKTLFAKRGFMKSHCGVRAQSVTWIAAQKKIVYIKKLMILLIGLSNSLLSVFGSIQVIQFL